MNDGPYDVAIIGGSFAGLTAALQLGRASRRTLVFDAGAPRNRFSPAAHGVPGWDGTPPGEILGRFRSDLAAYPSVQIQADRVVQVDGRQDAFSVETDGGDRVSARRIVLAHGVRDILPDIPGLAENWGRTVLHCPYCHGYEVRDRPLAVLATGPMAAHQAQLLRADWSEAVTLLTAGMGGFDADALTKVGVKVDPRNVKAVRSDATGLALTLSDGAPMAVAALFLGPTASIAETPAEHLGCALADGPMGPYVQVGPMGQTSVPGVFAAGDLARPAPNVNFAIADGTQAGIGCHASLVFPDFVQPLQQEVAA
ncbi:NAD(P)/FAD-dependent oxidoreductase [Aestuariibius sp. 2305UL40-4]|uniref:NAD(P)/FAD-dependent oxidoreductase n=1 Tax=Aestuariibius violaceus TaxID=3234132 RepID=UPI00345E8F27